MRKLIGLFALLALLGAQTVFAQGREVTGTVVDRGDRQPMPGVSVVVKGSPATGVATDINGRFAIKVSDSDILVFSFVGMKTQEVSVAGKNHIEVDIDPATEALEEVVVTGYGTAKKAGAVVGAVGTVDNKKLGKMVTANFTDALAGSVSGLAVYSGSGDPSDLPSIRLRGVSSVDASTTPLFILDGAPISSLLFNTLNPSDIENITVLKDASATAIYGSRAANGVIVITSKKGRFGQKATVTLKAHYGFSQMVEDKVKMMNSEEYIAFRDKIGVPVSVAARDAWEKYGINTNWRKEIFDSSSPTYTVDFSVTGGGKDVAYYLAFNHHDQQGIIENTGMRREAIRFNFSAKVNDWMKVGLQSNLGFSKYTQNAAVGGVYLNNPVTFTRLALPYDSPRDYSIENGNIVYGEKTKKLHYSNMTSIWFDLENKEEIQRDVTANLVMFEEFTPIKGLTLRAQQALDAFEWTNSYHYFPLEEQYNGFGDKISSRTGSASQTFQRNYSFTYTNTAEYKLNLGRHAITLLAGQESIISKSRNFGAGSSGHTDRRQMKITQGVKVAVSDLREGLSETTVNSYFFNGSYAFDNRYLFDATVRRDGSSKFAPGNRWSTFYSVGAKWDIRKEKFMPALPWLNDLALKGSYGTVGNSGIGNYAYFGLIGSGSTPYNGGATLGIANASNYDLSWETVKSANVGLSFRVFDRLSVEADYYNKKTEDMLMDIPYSLTTGFSSGSGNVGTMVNQGIDLDVKVDILKTNEFYWAVKGTFNYNKNKITKLFDGRDEFAMPEYGLKYQIGHDVGELYKVRFAGVDALDGTQIWYDKNGNPTKSWNEDEDAVLLGQSMFAPYSGGFGTEFQWKGLSLRADFTWAKDKFVSTNEGYFLENSTQCTSYNQSKRMMNIWTKPGDVTDVPKYGIAPQFDSHLVEDASFLRLKNVTLQYSLPQNIVRYAGLSNVSVFAIGRNLFTCTKFRGFDPEPETNNMRYQYPNTRQYVFGIEVSF